MVPVRSLLTCSLEIRFLKGTLPALILVAVFFSLVLLERKC